MNATTPKKKKKKKKKWSQQAWELLAALPLLLLVVPLLLLVLIFYIGYSLCLHLVIWVRWCGRGRDILFVYSDSPIWRAHIEEVILPHLQHRAVILNWSQRKQWRTSLAKAAFHHFGGRSEFNPMAVVFRPCRFTRVYRFWKAFRDFKHGNTAPLREMESRFLNAIGQR